ncbi:MAG: hypothetical protein WCG78_03955 [Candidatus Omnitrophota bacterium]
MIRFSYKTIMFIISIVLLAGQLAWAVEGSGTLRPLALMEKTSVISDEAAQRVADVNGQIQRQRLAIRDALGPHIDNTVEIAFNFLSKAHEDGLKGEIAGVIGCDKAIIDGAFDEAGCFGSRRYSWYGQEINDLIADIVLKVGTSSGRSLDGQGWKTLMDTARGLPSIFTRWDRMSSRRREQIARDILTRRHEDEATRWRTSYVDLRRLPGGEKGAAWRSIAQALAEGLGLPPKSITLGKLKKAASGVQFKGIPPGRIATLYVVFRHLANQISTEPEIDIDRSVRWLAENLENVFREQLVTVERDVARTVRITSLREADSGV